MQLLLCGGLDERSSAAWLGKAVTLAELGRTREALEALSHLLALEPDHPQGIRLCGMLDG